MKKFATLAVVVALILSFTGATLAAGQPENKLSLEVLYNLPYNSSYAVGGPAIGLVYPFWSIFRLSADAQFKFDDHGGNNPPGLVAGTGLSIPLGGFRFIIDYKKGFDLSSGGINDYGDIRDLGIDLPLNEKYTFRSYVRNINHFGSQYSIPNDKMSYIGFGFNYKL